MSDLPASTSTSTSTSTGSSSSSGNWSDAQVIRLLMVMIGQSAESHRWPAIAAAMGPSYTSNAVKKKFTRIRGANSALFDSAGSSGTGGSGTAAAATPRRKKKLSSRAAKAGTKKISARAPSGAGASESAAQGDV